MRALEPKVRALAAELIEPIAARGEGDLAAELSRPFAVRVLGLLIGLSDESQQKIREHTQTMWKHLSRDSDASQFWPAYQAVLGDEIRRAREQPGDYYLSWLANTHVDGEPVPDDQLYSIIVSYCVAGHDNTMNTISRIVWCLARDAELQARVRSEPAVRPQVVEEVLRRWCPTDRFTRVTTREVTIDGVTIPAGARVVLLFDAANRDPYKFPDPEEFQADRDNAQHHLSFGHGIHRCIGANFARTEFDAVLTELARHPTFSLAEEPRRYFENGRHIMFESIPVRFRR
jgi:cytochrome P450